MPILARFHWTTWHKIVGILGRIAAISIPGDFVAVGDTNQRIGAVGIGPYTPRYRQLNHGSAIEHTVTHGDTIIHRNGVKFWQHHLPLQSRGQPTDPSLLGVRDRVKLGKRVGNRDNRFVKVPISRHTGCTPKCVPAILRCQTWRFWAILWHGCSLFLTVNTSDKFST